MNRPATLSNGLNRIRTQFLIKLSERRDLILQYALAAAEASHQNDVARNLSRAKDVLHQIAGTAGTLGFGTFGADARRLEEAIAAIDTTNVPDDLYEQLLKFAHDCEEIIKY